MGKKYQRKQQKSHHRTRQEPWTEVNTSVLIVTDMDMELGIVIEREKMKRRARWNNKF